LSQINLIYMMIEKYNKHFSHCFYIVFFSYFILIFICLFVKIRIYIFHFFRRVGTNTHTWFLQCRNLHNYYIRVGYGVVSYYYISTVTGVWCYFCGMALHRFYKSTLCAARIFTSGCHVVL